MAGKTKKQEILAPDKFQVFLERARDYILINKRNIIVGTVVATLIVALGAGWAYWRQGEEARAANLYNQAVLTNSRLAVMNQTVEAVVKPYQEVTSKYPGSRAAVLSQFRMGNAYLNAGQEDEAINSFKAFLKGKSGDNELAALAYNGLGYCYEAKKDFKEALNNYEKALQSRASGPFSGDIMAGMARCCEGLQNNGKAQEYYRQAIEKVHDPTLKMLLGRRLAMLG